MTLPTGVSKSKLLLIGLFLGLLSLLVYARLTITFFQQDEWAVFGNLLYWEKANLSWFDRLLVYEQGTHLLPLSNFFSWLQFRLFGLNFSGYALFSLLIHGLNSFLVFYLSFLLLKKPWPGLLAGAFFAISSLSHQAITWTATSTGTLGAAFFLLLSLIFFARKKPTISFLMVAVSLFFKESSIFLFLLLPVFWWLFFKKDGFSKIIRVFSPLFLLGLAYGLLRLFLRWNAPVSLAAKEALSQPSSPLVYFYRLLTVPLKALAQAFFPAELILSLARLNVKLAYPHFVLEGAADPYLVESVAADAVSFGLAFLILLLFWFLFLRLKEKSLSRGLSFSLGLIILASLPFIIIPGKAGYFSIFEPRHLYLLGIGSSLFLAIVFNRLKRKKVLTVTLLTLIFIFHFSKIQLDLQKQVEIGRLRKFLLEQIKTAYPQLPEKVVFYTQSDRAFYGLPPEEKILPFQSGLGQTLLVWYDTQSREWPACFFQKKYLYEQLAQDYRFCQGRGFGYFRDFEKLTRALKANNLDKESVIAFTYHSGRQSLDDITQEIRKRLNDEL